MKIKLTGVRVRHIRNTLGMDPAQFGAVLAIHPGTVHRWESEGERPVSIDGVAAGLLAALDQKVDQPQPGTSNFRPEEVGPQVVQALLVGGALFALGLLIAELVGDNKR